MRARLPLLASLALAVACASGPAPKADTADKTPPPPPAAPLELTSLEPVDNTLLSFNFKVTGKLGTGVDGKELEWSAKEGAEPRGSGTVSIEIAADRTFTATIPIVFAKTVEDLAPYADKESVEVTVDAKVGSASTTRTQRIRSPKIPIAKIQSVQATKSGPDTIELTYWFAIDNQNLYPLKMQGVDYKAYLGGKLVSEVSLPTEPRLRAAAQTEYTLNAQANPQNCGKELKAMMKLTTVKWNFTGVVHYSNLDVPFTLEGDLKMTKE